MTTPTPSADVLSRQREVPDSIAATDRIIPIVFGETVVTGRIFQVDYSDPEWTVGVLWCMGEQSVVPEIYLDGANPLDGVVINTYRGTLEQQVDPLLAGAVANYNFRMRVNRNGVMRGICYSVIQYTNTHYSSRPRFSALVRGVVNTSNPVRAIQYLIEDPVEGFGETVDSTTFNSAADWCDEILDDARPRRQLGLALDERKSIEQWIEILSGYARCWVFPEHGIWQCIADRPTTPSTTIYREDYQKDSLILSQRRATNSPQSVIVEYEKLQNGIRIKGEAQATLPNVERVERISRVKMPGIHSYSEALRQATERLNEFNLGKKIQFRGGPDLVQHTFGDVVSVELPDKTQRVIRIDRPAVGGGSNWTLSGHEYDDSVYSDEATTAPDLTIGDVVIDGSGS